MAPEKTSDRVVQPTTGTRPKQTYVELIKHAINQRGGEGAALQEIYESIQTAHAYFSPDGKGWKNSVRHTLSLNPAFQNMPRTDPQPGKGGLWRIDHTAPEIFTRKRNPKPSQRAKLEAAAAAATANEGGREAGGLGAVAEASSSSASSGQPPAKRARTGLSPPHSSTSKGGLAAIDVVGGLGGDVDDSSGTQRRSASPPRPQLSSIYVPQSYNQYQQQQPYQGAGQDAPAFLPTLWGGQPSTFDPSLVHGAGVGPPSDGLPSAFGYPTHASPLPPHVYSGYPHQFNQPYGGNNLHHPYAAQHQSQQQQGPHLPQLHLNPLGVQQQQQGSRSPGAFPYPSQSSSSQPPLASPRQQAYAPTFAADRTGTLPPSSVAFGGAGPLDGRSAYSYETAPYRAAPPPPHFGQLPPAHYPYMPPTAYGDPSQAAAPYLADAYGNGGGSTPQVEPLQHHLSGHSTQSSSSASTPQHAYETTKSWPPPPPGLIQPLPNPLQQQQLRSPAVKAEPPLLNSSSILPPQNGGEASDAVKVETSS